MRRDGKFFLWFDGKVDFSQGALCGKSSSGNREGNYDYEEMQSQEEQLDSHRLRSDCDDDRKENFLQF